MTETRIRVDFNRRNGDGLVLASHRSLGNAVVVPGDRVIVFQPGENMEHFAQVISVDDDSGRISFEVDWASDPSAALTAPYNEKLRTYFTRAIFGNVASYRSSQVSTSPVYATGSRGLTPTGILVK